MPVSTTLTKCPGLPGGRGAAGSQGACGGREAGSTPTAQLSCLRGDAERGRQGTVPLRQHRPSLPQREPQGAAGPLCSVVLPEQWLLGDGISECFLL